MSLADPFGFEAMDAVGCFGLSDLYFRTQYGNSLSYAIYYIPDSFPFQRPVKEATCITEDVSDGGSKGRVLR